MKTISKFLILTLAATTFFASCDMSNQSASAVGAKHQINLDETRGIQMLNLAGDQVAVAKTDIIELSKAANANADEEAVTNIMSSLMAAEKEDQLLDIKFTMSDETVDEGLFVFGVQTEEEKELTIQLFDEEGFTIQANNTINVTAGNNYKALNVRSLKNGSYYLKIKDSEDKELTRKLVVENK